MSSYVLRITGCVGWGNDNHVAGWNGVRRGKVMTFEQLEYYISAGHAIEYTYHGKKYSITYWYPDENEDNAKAA